MDRAIPSPDPDQLAEDDRDVAELLARIEDRDLVSGWVWPHLTETLNHLSGLGPALSRLRVSYLKAVAHYGDRMFDRVVSTLSMLNEEQALPTVPCPCGVDIPGARPQRRDGRDIVLVVCPSCLRDVAVYDGTPWAEPTMRARM